MAGAIAEDVGTPRPGRILCLASFGIIVKEPVISAVRHVVNVHPGVLPGYRGRHPLPQAIVHGERMMGCTVHLVDGPEIDAGPVLARAELPIDYSASYESNERRLRQLMGHLTETVLDQLLDGSAVSVAWDAAAEGRYHPPLGSERLRALLDAPALRDFPKDRG